MKRFAVIGVGGFVAPRHLRAIKETGNIVTAAVDPSDSVGIIDQFFPDVHFFTEFERFDRHIDKLRRRGPAHQVDYVSICSPNYLHDAHIRFALRSQAHAICEKPLVLNPWNLDALQDFEAESDRHVFTVLQLRLHPSIIDLKRRIDANPTAQNFTIDLTYVTSRGRWYGVSWKGDPSKSGGIATNIGIHFFDMLIWIFGSVKENQVYLSTPTRAAGHLTLERAQVRWFLSLERDDLPEAALTQGRTTHRSIEINGEALEFSEGFTDLHTKIYNEILAGRGFNLEDARPSIEVVHTIRNATPKGLDNENNRFSKEEQFQKE